MRGGWISNEIRRRTTNGRALPIFVPPVVVRRFDPSRCYAVGAVNTPRASRGSQRRYCGAGVMESPRAAAACHGQRGS